MRMSTCITGAVEPHFVKLGGNNKYYELVGVQIADSR